MNEPQNHPQGHPARHACCRRIPRPPLWLGLGALNALVAVAAGAYGWHALAADEAGRGIFMMGSQYQMWHGLALVAVGLAAKQFPARRCTLDAAGALFLVGILFFSGTLYAFGQFNVVPVPHLAPAGGVCLMAGWAALIIAAVRARNDSRNDD